MERKTRGCVNRVGRHPVVTCGSDWECESPESCLARCRFSGEPSERGLVAASCLVRPGQAVAFAVADQERSSYYLPADHQLAAAAAASAVGVAVVVVVVDVAAEPAAVDGVAAEPAAAAAAAAAAAVGSVAAAEPVVVAVAAASVTVVAAELAAAELAAAAAAVAVAVGSAGRPHHLFAPPDASPNPKVSARASGKRS